MSCYTRYSVTDGERNQPNPHDPPSSSLICCGETVVADYCTKISESVPNLCDPQSTNDIRYIRKTSARSSPNYLINSVDTKTSSIDNEDETNEAIYRSNSISFLAEREMPITRDRDTINKVMSNSRQTGNEKKLDGGGGRNSIDRSMEKIVPKIGAISGSIKNSISPTYRRKIR